MRVWILRVLGFLLGGFVGVLFVGIIASLTVAACKHNPAGAITSALSGSD